MKTILAAVDFSPVTKRVVAEAIGLARTAGARLVLLNVTTPESFVGDYAALQAMLFSADPQNGKGRALDAPAVHGESLQIVGDPVDVILEQAARCSADYIVMGSHGHTSLFEVIVGGTAAGVIHGTKCPVILIPPIARKEEKWIPRLRQKDPVAWLQRAGRKTAASVPLKSKQRRRPT